MSSPTELLAVAGKAVAPASPKQGADAQTVEKTPDFSEAYGNSSSKTPMAKTAKPETESKEITPVLTTESDVLEALETGEPLPDDQIKTTDITLDPATIEAVPTTLPAENEVVKVAEVEAVEPIEKAEKLLTVVNEPTQLEEPALVKPSQPLETTKKEKETQESAPDQSVQPKIERETAKELMSEPLNVAPNVDVRKEQKVLIRSEGAAIVQKDDSPEPEVKVEKVELARAAKPEQANQQTASPLQLQPAQQSRPDLPREDLLKREAIAIETKRDAKEARNSDVALKQTVTFPVAAPTQPSVTQPTLPAWLSMTQTDQTREIVASIAPSALEELSGYQQQARFEPVSAYQRYDAPVQTAKQVVQQVAYAVSQNTAGTTEIKLSPEELGRVRMTVQAVEGVVTVSVIAERQETGDLMRRNSEVLTDELRDLGFENINLSFGNEPSSDQAKEHEDQSDLAFAGHASNTEDGKTVIVSRALAEGLDLRM